MKKFHLFLLLNVNFLLFPPRLDYTITLCHVHEVSLTFDLPTQSCGGTGVNSFSICSDHWDKVKRDVDKQMNQRVIHSHMRDDQ